MKKVFLSVLMLAGMASIAMADHQETLTVTVPAETNACYAIGTFNNWSLENIIPMDLVSSTAENHVFSCKITVPDILPDDKEKQKFKFLAGGQDWGYLQTEGDFYYKDGYNRTVTGFGKYASYGNVVRFVCSATTEKVYLAGKFADNDWSKDKMIRMVAVDSTTTTKTFQARVGTDSDNMEFKYMPWAREWDNSTTSSNNNFNDMKDAQGVATNEYIMVNITVPDGTKEVYLMGKWGGKDTNEGRAHKCVKTGDNTFVGVIPSTATCDFRCYNKKNTSYYEAKDSQGNKRDYRSTGDAVNKTMNITVDYWHYAEEFTQYYLTGIDGWSATQKKMNADSSITLTNISKGEHEIRVTRGNWTDPLDFYDLDTEHSSEHLYIVKPSSDKNIGFYMASDNSTLTVKVTKDETLIVTGDMIAKQTQYYIAGANNLSSSGDWSATRYKMEANGTKTINLPAGERQMKIGTGDWNNMFTFADVNTLSSSPYIYTSGTGGNICFYLTAQGDVNISVVEGKVIVTGQTIGEKPLQYYLTGIDGWGVTQHSLDMTTRSYKKEKLNAGDYQCKITDGSWDNTLKYADVNQSLSNIALQEGDTNNIKFHLDKKTDMLFQVKDGKVVVNQLYYITGSFNNNWSDNFLSMDTFARSYTKELAAGAHEFKVYGTKGWNDHELKYENVSKTLSSPNVFTTNGNIGILLAEAGQVTIKVVDGDSVVVTGNFSPTATYTLEGNGGSDNTKTWCHGKDWNTSASQMFGDTIRFHNVPAGTWKCKVTNLKKEFEWGYNEVVLDASSCLVKNEGDNGIRLEVPYMSDIAIRVVAPDAEKKIVVYVSPAVLDEAEDNSSLINSMHNKTVDAQLKRSFIADGYWYTLCLPFSRSEEQVQTELGACQLMKLNSSYLKSSDMLYLDFEAETAIEAGVPYLFMPEADVENPIFHAVTADKNASKVVETDKASMTGFYQPTVVEATNYFLGDENYLKRNNDESTSKAFRAYFTLNDNVPAGVMARAVFGHSTPTDLKQTKAIEENRKIIVNGHLCILRAGARYTITGQRL